MNDKVKKFELDPKTVKVKELLNKDFLEVEIKAISTANPNRNGSYFTRESLEKAIPTFYNKPILGSFSTDIDDFRAHEGDLGYDEELENLYYDYTSEKAETPLGMIRGDDLVTVIHSEQDNLDWVVFTCAIWVKYNYKQVKKLLKSKNGHKKISVEIEVNDSEFDENGIEVIKDFTFDGVTILGDKYETGIADANMTILDMVDNALFARKQKALAFAYNSLEKVDNPEEIKSIQDSNTNFEENPVVNEGKPEVTMDEETNEKGGVSKVNLTMQAKLELLEQKLFEVAKGNEGDPYIWVCDLDDNYVYFNYQCDTYRCPYSIIEGEESSEIVVAFEEKERVIRSWAIFSAEESESKEESFEKQEEACEEKQEEACDDKEEESCDKEEEACGEKEDEACEAKEDEACDCGEKEEEACEEKQEECNTFAAESVDLNSEPETPDVDDKSMSEVVSEATEAISAPDVQIDAEHLGEANKNVEEVLDCPVEPTTAVVGEPYDAPVDEHVNDSSEKTDVEQPDDQAKGEMFSVDDQEITGAELFEKYTELRKKYEEMVEATKIAAVKAIAKAGKNFVSSDSVVDEESKADFIKQINEKCESYEFTTEEEVIKFAKSLLAMYYYENQAQNKEKVEEFSAPIEQPAHNEKKASKLKDAINKLNYTETL